MSLSNSKDWLVFNCTFNTKKRSYSTMTKHTQSFYCSSGICPRPPGWAGTRKVKPGTVKPIWIYWSKRHWEAVTSAGLCASLHLIPDNHANIPPLSFLQARSSSYHPTNSVKALKESPWQISRDVSKDTLWGQGQCFSRLRPVPFEDPDPRTLTGCSTASENDVLANTWHKLIQRISDALT